MIDIENPKRKKSIQKPVLLFNHETSEISSMLVLTLAALNDVADRQSPQWLANRVGYHDLPPMQHQTVPLAYHLLRSRIRGYLIYHNGNSPRAC